MQPETDKKKNQHTAFKYAPFVINQAPYKSENKTEIKEKGTFNYYSEFADMLRKKCGLNNNFVIARYGNAAFNGQAFHTLPDITLKQFVISLNGFQFYLSQTNAAVVYVVSLQGDHIF